MKKGFTLIELLVVIAIIGILAAIVVVATSSSRWKAKNTKIKSDMATIAKAAELYYYKDQKFPTDQSPGSAPAFVPEFLDVWPISPCDPDVVYDWENWPGGNEGWEPIVRVSLRRERDLDGDPDDSTIYYQCIEPNRDGKCICNDYAGSSWYCKGYAPIADTTQNTLSCEDYMDEAQFPRYWWPPSP